MIVHLKTMNGYENLFIDMVHIPRVGDYVSGRFLVVDENAEGNGYEDADVSYLSTRDFKVIRVHWGVDQPPILYLDKGVTIGRDIRDNPDREIYPPLPDKRYE